MTKSIAAFQDEHGRVSGWPSDRRRAHQLAVLSHLAGLLDGGRLYSEDELLTFLDDQATIDPQLLKAELLEGNYLSSDDQQYWKAGSRPQKH